ncbi:hypothetical protein T4A_13654 [Trichinella pseudospiralis]|uniref:Uncharacterized protein n=1 Tax=Trichinella pseudospiralis TaxID=6337 RepID=A0A0V1DXY2_TRIPS|nr:hypothetical protein T4A_13654 [Trichinella pseudospiralis]
MTSMYLLYTHDSKLISIGLNKMLLSKTKTGCDFVFGEFGINYRLLYRCEIVIEQRIRLSVSVFKGFSL